MQNWPRIQTFLDMLIKTIYKFILYFIWKVSKDFLGRGGFINIHWKVCFSSPTFPPNLPLYFKRLKIIINRKIQSIFLVQNFTSFLMDSIIFALGLFLRLKNADKVDPLKIQCFWSQISYSSTLLAFLSHKRCPRAKMNQFNRKLVKFWTKRMLHIFLLIIFWAFWNKKED